MTETVPLDFADPTLTIRLLDELEGVYGMTIDQFRRLHHLPDSGNLSISGHRNYARARLRRATRRFSGQDKNVGTARRLAICLDGLRAKLPWDDAITLAGSGSVGAAPPDTERRAIRNMLLRRPIDRAQRAFYKCVLESSANCFRKSEMETKLEFGSRSFLSALNALSLRINETPGLTDSRPGYRFVFDVADEGDDRIYIGKPALVDELRANPDLVAALSRDWRTVLDDEAFVSGASGQPASTLLDRCVYTILHRDKFDEGLASQRLIFEEGKSWTGAKRWLDEARDKERRLAVVLADAEQCRDLIGWGLIDELTVTDGHTRVVVSQLRTITGRSQQELIVASSKQPIADGHIRPYVLCDAPEFLLDDADIPFAGQVTSDDSAVTLDDEPTTENAHGHLQVAAGPNVESDPVAYELVQRRLRRHQSAFRESLMRAYRGRCAISGTNVAAVLEAAHIEPHVERGDNSAENGLLLRSDLHALFDEGLLRIHPTTLEVHLDPTIDDPAYAPFNGQRLRARADKVRVSIAALEARWRMQRSS